VGSIAARGKIADQQKTDCYPAFRQGESRRKRPLAVWWYFLD
jgi:hypothetical protein